MRYDDLFIDFDDTLCDTHGSAELALREVFREFQLEHRFADPEAFYTAYWQTNIELWQRYGRGEITRDFLIVERFRRPLSMGSGPVPTEEYCRQMGDRFLEYCVVMARPIEGARELVDYLRGRGYRLHLASNGFHEVQHRKIVACGMEGCFATVVLSEDAKANKPQRAFFDYAFRITGAQPATTLMIGDGWDSDMMGAIGYGLDTIYYNRFPDYPPPRPVTYEVKALADIKEIL